MQKIKCIRTDRLSCVKVSVVIPCYNVERFLDRCMESIVNQTLIDIEIILIDDFSQDNTPEKCDEWAKKDARIVVIHKKANEGLGIARNTGLLYAHGEYVSFIDSDDWVEPDMMERLYVECKKGNLDIIYSEFNVDEYPGFRVVPRAERNYVGFNEIELLRLDIVGAEPSYISGVKYHCSSCKGLYSLKLIKDNNLFFLSEKDFISEDMLFNLDALSYSKNVKIVPWQLYHYCLNGLSLTHNYRADRWDKQVKMLQALRDCGNFHNIDEFSLRLKRTAIFYSMISIFQERKRKDITCFQRMNKIREIENSPEIIRAVNNYPISKLPIKWKIYTLLLKNRLLEYIYCFGI